MQDFSDDEEDMQQEQPVGPPSCLPLAMFDVEVCSCSYHIASGVIPHQMSDGIDVSQTSCHGRGDDDLPGQHLLVRSLPCQRVSEHQFWPDLSE